LSQEAQLSFQNAWVYKLNFEEKVRKYEDKQMPLLSKAELRVQELVCNDSGNPMQSPLVLGYSARRLGLRGLPTHKFIPS